MNNIQELIGRHKCTEWIKGRCTECDEHYTDYVEKLHAALESMQAPLPEDVESKCNYLRGLAREFASEANAKLTPEAISGGVHRYPESTTVWKIADMLERLARENEQLHQQIYTRTVPDFAGADAEIKKLQQRIEELEHAQRINLSVHNPADIDKIKRLDAALAALSDPDWWDTETPNTAMDFAKKARAGE